MIADQTMIQQFAGGLTDRILGEQLPVLVAPRVLEELLDARYLFAVALVEPRERGCGAVPLESCGCPPGEATLRLRFTSQARTTCAAPDLFS